MLDAFGGGCGGNSDSGPESGLPGRPEGRFRCMPDSSPANIVYIWGLNGPDRPPNSSKKVKGFALHLSGRVWKPIGPV
jgi:hypothetical protein